MRHLIGFGNELHGDDGFAAAVCRRLQSCTLAEDVRVFDAGTRGLDALALFDNCESVILLDAIEPDGQPGRITEPDVTTLVQESEHAGHAAGVGYLIRVLQTFGHQPAIRVIAAEAAELKPFSMTLSPEMARAVDTVVASLSAELAACARKAVTDD